MYNYYIDEKLVEEYPKEMPRPFKFGETHYIGVVDGEEDITTKIDNELTSVNDYQNYDYQVSRAIEYGEIASQIAYITENGLDAWQNRVAAIKNKYPKEHEWNSSNSPIV